MKPNPSGGGGLVYTSEHGRMCPVCSRPVAECACQRRPKGGAAFGGPPVRGPVAGKSAGNPGKKPVPDGVVRVSRETKGRKGSGVTLITGLPLDAVGLEALAGDLKKRCGAGGAVKAGVIEIQGEHRDQLVALLQKLGHNAKRVGG